MAQANESMAAKLFAVLSKHTTHDGYSVASLTFDQGYYIVDILTYQSAYLIFASCRVA